MKDLTQGSVTKHLLHMSAFMAVSMMVQTLYLLADLFWVGRLGKEAIAAVGVAGNLTMIVLALTQMLGVGTTALISQAAGRKDQPHAELAFNQSCTMSIWIAIALGAVGFLWMDAYANSLSADATTAALAKAYLHWFLPALLLQFPLVSMGSALRATGIVQAPVIFQVISVVLNMVLAPFLIFGWIGFPKLGVTGAALATFISVLVADLLIIWYFEKKYHYLRFRFPLFRPQIKIWSAMLRIGVPAGAEFVLLFVYIMIVYVIIRNFGPAAQAGFGVGARVMQALFLPVVALSFAVSPVVGQNFGGRQADRVRQSVKSGLGIAASMMLVLALITWLAPEMMIRFFSKDAAVIQFGSDYLRIVAFNFVAAGIVFTSSSMFQGLGNTVPPLLSSASRLVLFALPALLLSRRAGFDIKLVWFLSVGSQLLQACMNLLLLRRELNRKLKFEDGAGFIPASATAS
ncbi:MAG TPA: MATE family efflux transporter [Chthoniobacterales bacterium]|jgi:putative MATE family efflux protein|nr:MATE family efflux transporter [Chthoniobacterales bacterium]